MDEYIKREAALMKLMQDGCSAKNLQSIADIPAADVEPVRRGRWVDFTNAACMCPVCGAILAAHSYYCPNCGAKMDGGAEDG